LRNPPSAKHSHPHPSLAQTPHICPRPPLPQSRQLAKQLEILSHAADAADGTEGGISIAVAQQLAEAQAAVASLTADKEALVKEKEALLVDLSEAIEMKMQLAAAKTRLRKEGIDD
jgi:hypothetical protein